MQALLCGAAMAALLRGAAALEPGEIVVICNAKSPNSQAVARHYMELRKIPAANLVELNCPGTDNITDEQYRKNFVPDLLKAIADKKLDVPKTGGTSGGVKCLVTMYGLPLRVLGKPLSKDERDEVAGMQKELDETVAILGREVKSYDAIAATVSTTPPASTSAPATAPANAGGGPPPKPTWQDALARLNTAAVAAGARIEKLPESQRPGVIEVFLSVHRRVAGVNGVVTVLHVPRDATDTDPIPERLSGYAIELRTLEEKYAKLLPQRDSPRIRKELVVVRGQAEGYLGKARALDELIEYIQPPNTDACLDNELALVFADQNYSRSNWLPNSKNIELYPDFKRLKEQAATNPAQAAAKMPPRTVMVTRLDGANVRNVQEMIDLTVKTEGIGLDGKIYLDARGLHGNDAYSAFDEDLRRAAQWLKEHAEIDTVLEDTPNLLQAKDAPACALVLWLVFAAQLPGLGAMGEGGRGLSRGVVRDADAA